MKPIRLGALACALLVWLAPLAAMAQQTTGAPFQWLEDSSFSITTGNSSAQVALKRMPTGVTQIRLSSNCTTWVFIRKGTDSTVTAAATDLPIAPGSVEVLTVLNNPSSPITNMAMISPSGTCTLYVTTGQGF